MNIKLAQPVNGYVRWKEGSVSLAAKNQEGLNSLPNGFSMFVITILIHILLGVHETSSQPAPHHFGTIFFFLHKIGVDEREGVDKLNLFLVSHEALIISK